MVRVFGCHIHTVYFRNIQPADRSYVILSVVGVPYAVIVADKQPVANRMKFKSMLVVGINRRLLNPGKASVN